MARARNIKPGFFRNADLVELPYEARLLFIGLWTIADRSGRLEDRPKQIKMELFPADSIDCDALLSMLQAIKMIERYEHGGARLIQVVNFDKHQNPHRDEKASTLPDRNGHIAEQAKAPCKHSANNMQDEKSNVPIGLIPDPLLLIPSSLIPETGNGRGSKSEEQSADADTPSPQKQKAKPATTLKTYLSRCRELGEKPVPEGHAIRKWARDAGITDEMLQIAWVKFKERYTEAEKGVAKSYKDWPGHFATSVKDNWFGVWFFGDDGLQWSSKGLTFRSVLDQQTRGGNEQG